MKTSINLLQESKKEKLFDLEAIDIEIKKTNEDLVKLKKKKEKFEKEITELEKAISKLEGSDKGK